MRALKNFFDFPLNAEMLDSTVKPYDPGAMALKYLGIVKDGIKADANQVEAVREGTIAYCKQVDDPETLKRDLVGIEEMWPELRERFMKSASLTQLVLDYFLNSRYMLRYLWLTGRLQFAAALAIKDGRMIPVAGGTFFEPIPKSDGAWLVVTREPVHIARRQTDYCCQTLLRNAKSIFEVGAGMLPAYSDLYDYPLGENGQWLVACDSNPNALGYATSLLGTDSMKNLTYICGDAREVATRPEYAKKMDIARLTGFLSYFPTLEQKMDVMQKVSGTLVSGGMIIVDQWTMGPSLARSGGTTLWPSGPSNPAPLVPSANPEVAIDEMEQIAKVLGLKCVYLIDQCNGNPKCLTQVKAVPKCVMFLLGNDVSEDMFDSVW